MNGFAPPKYPAPRLTPARPDWTEVRRLAFVVVVIWTSGALFVLDLLT